MFSTGEVSKYTLPPESKPQGKRLVSVLDTPMVFRNSFQRQTLLVFAMVHNLPCGCANSK